jgi:hypothetical protein
MVRIEWQTVVSWRHYKKEDDECGGALIQLKAEWLSLAKSPC